MRATVGRAEGRSFVLMIGAVGDITGCLPERGICGFISAALASSMSMRGGGDAVLRTLSVAESTSLPPFSMARNGEISLGMSRTARTNSSNGTCMVISGNSFSR